MAALSPTKSVAGGGEEVVHYLITYTAFFAFVAKPVCDVMPSKQSNIKTAGFPFRKY